MSDARAIANKLKIDLRRYPLEKWEAALRSERERRSDDDNNPLVPARTALAHIMEYPDYYDRLEVMEEEAKRYWHDKPKPNILRK